MEVIIHNEDLDRALRELKKRIFIDGIFAEVKDRQDCKPSIRKRNKKTKALRRLRKSQRRERQGGNHRDDTVTNCQWRFVHTDGEYLKVSVKRGEMHQV